MSVNKGRERWGLNHGFKKEKNMVSCRVVLQENLKILELSSRKDAVDLIKSVSEGFVEKNIIFHKISQLFWRRVAAHNNMDGILYKYTDYLHYNTFLKSWDCDSIVVFNPINATIVM